MIFSPHCTRITNFLGKILEKLYRGDFMLKYEKKNMSINKKSTDIERLN